MKGVIVAFCVFGGVVEARNLSLDLTGSGTSVPHLASAAAVTSSAAAVAADPTVVRMHRLMAGAARVSDLAVGDVIELKLFSDKTLSVTLAEKTDSLTGSSFLGRIDNALGALGCVVLETTDGIVLDVTDFEHQRVWQVVSDANGVTVREVKPTDKPRRCGGTPQPASSLPANATVTIENDVVTVVTNGVPTSSAKPIALKAVSSNVAALPKATSQTMAASDKPTVDILVNYDTDAAVWARSNGGGVTNFAETCVQKMNIALGNTGLDQYFRFRLVGVYEVGKSADGNPQLGLYLSEGRNVNYGGTLVNGWNDVLSERERVSADIVCTLVDNGTDRGTTGIGFSLESSTADPSSCGFNCCLIRAVANSHTMTHEVGHNMGAGHSDAMADASNCGPQYYSYSSGYYFYVGLKGYYTIMSYNADGYGNFYTEVPYFSSPDYKYSGVTVGDATHDNTKTLRLNYPMIVNNRRGPFVSAEVGEGLDATAYTWTTDGTYPWSRVTNRSSDGQDSASSCLSPSLGTSWTETKVQGPAMLSFKHWLTSYGGRFVVTCDGTEIYSYGGSTMDIQTYSWTSVGSLSIPSGVHTIRLSHINSNSTYYLPANAVWVDQLVFEGGQPAKEQGETSATPVPVPFDWLATYYPKTATSDYEALAAQTGANGYSVWESYVAGLDPTNATSVFKAVITMEDGTPVVRYEPELTPAQAALRTYTTYGKKTLKDLQWQKVTPGNESAYGFFYVTVEMK